MSMNDYRDAYKLFEAHPEAFSLAQTFPQFCILAEVEYYAHYAWIPRAFASAKEGKFTYHPVRFPKVNRFAELFEEVKLLPMPERNSNLIPNGFLSLTGNGGIAMHVGGKRGWSKTSKGTRSIYGAKFCMTYVKPKAEIANVAMTLVDRARSYEAIKRDDGILILAHDGLSIGREWIALLPLSENIEDLLSSEDRELIEREKADDIRAWKNIASVWDETSLMVRMRLLEPMNCGLDYSTWKWNELPESIQMELKGLQAPGNEAENAS